MRKTGKTRGRPEEGIALLIAIFVLLLISVVAISLLVSSGTETALGANYRSSSTVYYAALAGLEEARGRLLPKNPSYFGSSIISPTTTFPLGQTLYVINRLPGENIVPWDSSNAFFDSEYQSEFGIPASSASWQSVYSMWDNNTQGIPGPLFKWVRINAVTEASLFTDVNYSGAYNSSRPIFYDPANVDSHGNAWPSLISTSSLPSTAVQALEITALANLPNGSKKILQYLVAPTTLNLTFPAALTLDGFGDAFSGPNNPVFQISGNSDASDPACTGMPYPVAGINVPDLNPDVNNVKNGIPAISTGIPPGMGGNYIGNGAPPSISHGGLAANLQSVQSLNQISQMIVQNADVVLTGPADQTSMPPQMSNVNPMTIAVQGDFNLSSFTGYGLLLVTGKFTFSSDANWDGIVLVIGQGIANGTAGGSNGIFSGAMLVAQTVSGTGNPLSTLGAATFNSSGNSFGVYYNCYWIRNVQSPWTYKILSFHEIPQ